MSRLREEQGLDAGYLTVQGLHRLLASIALLFDTL
jgi:hypothetical protein